MPTHATLKPNVIAPIIREANVARYLDLECADSERA